jgi:predicted nucleic acid-binding protein
MLLRRRRQTASLDADAPTAMTFDSSVLIYAVSRSDPRHLTAAELIDRAARGDCRQTLQSLAECFSVLRRKYRMPAADGCSLFNGCFG